MGLGFCKSGSESTLYVKKKGVEVLIISLYVDDMLITGNNVSLIEGFK